MYLKCKMNQKKMSQVQFGEWKNDGKDNENN